MFHILTNFLPMPPPQLKRDLKLGNVDIIKVDSTNPEGADSLAKQAKVIITTVGPYRYMNSMSRVCCSPCGSAYMSGWVFLYMLSGTYPFVSDAYTHIRVRDHLHLLSSKQPLW